MIKFRSSSSNSSASSNSVGLTKPTGCANGDMLILYCQLQAETASGGGAFDTPSGWTKLTGVDGDHEQGGLGSSRHRITFWKIASSEPASYTITATGTTIHAMGVNMVCVQPTEGESLEILSGHQDWQSDAVNPLSVDAVTLTKPGLAVFGYVGTGTSPRTVSPTGTGYTTAEQLQYTGSSLDLLNYSAYKYNEVGSNGSPEFTLSGFLQVGYISWLVVTDANHNGLTIIGDNQAGGSSTSGLTVTVPTDVADGDQLLLAAAIALSSPSPRVNTPSGWSLIKEYKDTQFHFVVYKRIASSEPANYTVTFTETGAPAQLQLWAIRDDDGDPYVDTATCSVNSVASTATMTATGVTLTKDTLLFWVGQGYRLSGTYTVTPPSGFTEIADDDGTAGGGYTGIAVAFDQLTAGATGNKSGTANNTLYRHGSFLISVESGSPVSGDTLFNSHNF